jgi:hypothetical protein
LTDLSKALYHAWGYEVSVSELSDYERGNKDLSVYMQQRIATLLVAHIRHDAIEVNNAIMKPRKIDEDDKPLSTYDPIDYLDK